MIEHLRYCVECGERFLPHVVSCSDCGGVLKDIWEDDEKPREKVAAKPLLPEGEYQTIASNLSSAMAHAMVKSLAAAGIPAGVAATHHGEFAIGVRVEEQERALEILVEAGLRSRTPVLETAVDAEGGPCPACGAEVYAGVLECRFCGLVLGGELPKCEGCEADLPVVGACMKCGLYPRKDD